MSADDRATIEVLAREQRGSREARRMRKQGRLPGILYGRGRDPQAFSVNELELRAALKAGHALLDAQLGGETVPVIVKDQQHHPVRGGFTHIDLLEVDLKQKIHSTVPLELIGVDDAPGVVQGGVLDHVTRELNIEALPTDIPDSVTIDVSALEMNTTFLLSEATIPSNLTVLDDPEETVIATITPPTKAEAPVEVEEETELVGEGEAEGEGEESSEGEGGE
ncbi:MAG: 50S ribosomal protein L25 [Thermoleophilia bacterium]|nr:50S ribosomal protein L25 [Thermoleophilia bacterium]